MGVTRRAAQTDALSRYRAHVARQAATIALVGLAVAFGGCGGSSDAAPISADAAKQALAAALDRPLVDNVISGPDTTTSMIARSFTGGSEFEHIVAVVFREPNGSAALTGRAGMPRIPGPDSTAVIRVENVVVLYSRRRGSTNRGPALRRALRAVCSGCGGR